LIRHIDWPQPAYELMLAGFKGVVTPGQGGTASTTFTGFPLDSWPMLGKTGTSQNGKKPETGLPQQDTSLFVGCGPLPSVAWCDMTVMAYAGAGADAAAPAVRRVLQPIAEHKKLPLPKGGRFDADKLAKDVVILTNNSKTD
ncbi:MAG TPA: penicillin-binding transpeptidase domain-containing protein, partial [Acidimicrobiales bacterium]